MESVQLTFHNLNQGYGYVQGKENADGNWCESSQLDDSTRTTSNKVKKKKTEREKDSKTGEECKPGGGCRKNIRSLISDSCLKGYTKAATKSEQERKKRVKERQKLYGEYLKPEFDDSGNPKRVVLEVDPESKEPLVEVHSSLVAKLKRHQIEGIHFIWEAVIESLDQLKNGPGSGCILAHSMGLGKSLQIIAFVQTIMSNPFTKDTVKTALIICPFNTVLNWEKEFKQWLNEEELKLKVYHLLDVKESKPRALYIKEWQSSGGVLILGYTMFRMLTDDRARNIARKWRDVFFEALVYPGPDLVVCDEGHILKSSGTSLSKAIGRIKTLRRIVLTGTPLQNNLKEYHTMVHFVKPHLLGTLREFRNRFIHPIMNGQCVDSTPKDFVLMKKRVHVLHGLLEGCVQRFDYNILTPYLPPKHEYIVSVRMSELQIKLYSYYLENYTKRKLESRNTVGGTLFTDYNILKDIWTHPYLLCQTMTRKSYAISDDEVDYCSEDLVSDTEEDEKKQEKGGRKECVDDSTDDDDSQIKQIADDVEEVVRQWTTKRSRGELGQSSGTLDEREITWWNEFVDEKDETKIEMSGKLIVLFDILKECEKVGDKLILFSQCLGTLDLIEKILVNISSQTECAQESVPSHVGTWINGIDYFRIDGSTSVEVRQKYIDTFNDMSDRSRLMLISTKAGSLGTNLVGANRVVIIDASWNPVHDVQAIFRVFRFGQTKPVFVYRLLAEGTMEEKIYDRQVTKESLSFRVVDERQMERHFKAAELQELYTFDPASHKDRPVPIVPKDDILADLLIRHKDWIAGYHEHDSLLQRSPEEDLTEEERKAAWLEYETEREGRATATAERNERIARNQDARNKLKENLMKMIADVKNKLSDMSPANLNKSLYNALSKTYSIYQHHKRLLFRHKKKLESSGKPVPQSVNQRLSQMQLVLRELKTNMNELKIGSAEEVVESMPSNPSHHQMLAVNAVTQVSSMSTVSLEPNIMPKPLWQPMFSAFSRENESITSLQSPARPPSPESSVQSILSSAAAASSMLQTLLVAGKSGMQPLPQKHNNCFPESLSSTVSLSMLPSSLSHLSVQSVSVISRRQSSDPKTSSLYQPIQPKPPTVCDPFQLPVIQNFRRHQEFDLSQSHNVSLPVSFPSTLPFGSFSNNFAPSVTSNPRVLQSNSIDSFSLPQGETYDDPLQPVSVTGTHSIASILLPSGNQGNSTCIATGSMQNSRTVSLDQSTSSRTVCDQASFQLPPMANGLNENQLSILSSNQNCSSPSSMYLTEESQRFSSMLRDISTSYANVLPPGVNISSFQQPLPSVSQSQTFPTESLNDNYRTVNAVARNRQQMPHSSSASSSAQFQIQNVSNSQPLSSLNITPNHPDPSLVPTSESNGTSSVIVKTVATSHLFQQEKPGLSSQKFLLPRFSGPAIDVDRVDTYAPSYVNLGGMQQPLQTPSASQYVGNLAKANLIRNATTHNSNIHYT